jgi:hypothetical protein
MPFSFLLLLYAPAIQVTFIFGFDACNPRVLCVPAQRDLPPSQKIVFDGPTQDLPIRVIFSRALIFHAHEPVSPPPRKHAWHEGHRFLLDDQQLFLEVLGGVGSLSPFTP